MGHRICFTIYIFFLNPNYKNNNFSIVVPKIMSFTSYGICMARNGFGSNCTNLTRLNISQLVANLRVDWIERIGPSNGWGLVKSKLYI